MSTTRPPTRTRPCEQHKTPPKPGKPLAGPATHDSVLLTWTVLGNTSKVTNYNLTYRTLNKDTNAKGQWLLFETEDAEPKCKVENLVPETSYQFRVAVNTNDGSSPQSEISDVITTTAVSSLPSACSELYSTAKNPNNTRGKMPPKPEKPFLAGPATHNSLSIVWQVRGDTTRVTHYTLTYRTIDKGITATGRWMMLETEGAKCKCLVRYLDPETSYQFRVAANTDDGLSPQSETSDVVTTTAIPLPATPTAIRLVEQPTHHSMKLTWDIEDDSKDVNSYMLSYKTLEDKKWTDQPNMCENPVSVWDLKPNTKYVYKVVAHSGFGSSLPSACSEPFSTAKDPNNARGMPPKPEKPFLAGPATHNSLCIAWQVLGDTARVTRYTLTYRTIDKETKATGRCMMQETEGAERKCLVGYLDPETSYQFRVATNTDVGSSPQSETSDVITTTSVPLPATPTARRLVEQPTHKSMNPVATATLPLPLPPGVPTLVNPPTQDSVTLTWKVADYDLHKVMHYTVYYQNPDSDNWMSRVTEGPDTTTTVPALNPGTSYQFRVVAHTTECDSPSSEISKPIITAKIPSNPGTPGKEGGHFMTNDFRTPGPIFRENILKHSKTVETDKDMPLYQVPLRNRHKHVRGNIQKLDFGVPKVRHTPEEKVILVVGATGVGKSTLINGLINYVLGVEWDDNYRFRLVEESGSFAAQHKSQTQGIHVYTLHHQDEFQIPYTLTIIDTPGFGDTSGTDRDKKITKAITDLFSKSEYGIDHIDAVGFVTQASLPRLTYTQQYIFNSILSLFGKDIASNIFLLVTFCDAQKPPVLASIDEAKIPFHSSFKFNNSALFADNKSESSGFDQMFWEMGVLSLERFLSTLVGIEGKSLYLTKEVLEKRRQLEVYVAGIQEDIQKGLKKLEQYKTELDVVKKHESDILRNRNFTYTVDDHTSVQEDLKPGEYVTNCLQCNRTCHFPCKIPNNKEKDRCSAMDPSTGNCRVCIGECCWNLHQNVSYRIVDKIVKVKKTADDLKKRYEMASGEKKNAEKLTENILDDFYALDMNIIYMVDEVRKGVTKLNEMALRPNPLSTVDYLELMIQSEKAERKPGWIARIDQLTIVTAQAETLSKLAKDGYDPFAEYKKMLNMAGSNKQSLSWKSVAENIRQKCGLTFFGVNSALGLR